MKVKAQTKLQLAPSAWGKSTQVGGEVKHDIFSKRQDEIFFLPEHGEPWLILF